MPLRNEPKGLRESAMVTIARHFDNICYNCKSFTEMRRMLDDETYLEIEGPFRKMPPSLCLGLQDALRSELGHLRSRHLNGLIHQYQEEFGISEVGDKHFALMVLRERCLRLRRLNLSYLCHMSPTMVIQLMPTLTHLVYLNLSMTETVDQVLDLIGCYCKELRELDVSCCPITSDGLHRLCFDAAENKSRCVKLYYLNIVGCLISVEAVSFLLQKIPTVRELNFENIFRVFNVIDGEGLKLETLNSPVFHLNQLTSTDDIITPTCADVAVTLCPLVTNVTISNSIVDNEVLYKTMNLEHLLHLRLTNNESLSLDFNEGVLPVLMVRGYQLHSLLLANFTSANVNAIGECCPKLRNLALSNITIFEEIMYPRNDLFTQLNAIEIWTDLSISSMSSVILKQLLGFCPEIHNILISGSLMLTDKLVLEIWKTNDMKELSRVTLENCPQISRCILDYLLDTTNKLVLMRVWSCFLVTREDNDHLQKRIKKENCDVYLEWYSWQG